MIVEIGDYPTPDAVQAAADYIAAGTGGSAAVAGVEIAGRPAGTEGGGATGTEITAVMLGMLATAVRARRAATRRARNAS